MYGFNFKEEFEKVLEQNKEHFAKEEFNPYNNSKKAQSECEHIWEDGTDAIYMNHKGERICAICKKKI